LIADSTSDIDCDFSDINSCDLDSYGKDTEVRWERSLIVSLSPGRWYWSGAQILVTKSPSMISQKSFCSVVGLEYFFLWSLGNSLSPPIYQSRGYFSRGRGGGRLTRERPFHHTIDLFVSHQNSGLRYLYVVVL
jgi:hypothetical protein